MEADPIGLKGGWNPYAYAGNDPVNHTDAMGLNRNSRYLPAIRPTTDPLILANVQSLVRQIRQHNPAFEYNVVTPAGQPTYSIRDVQQLQGALREYNKPSKGAEPTLPQGMTNREFGKLTGWGTAEASARNKLRDGYTNAEVQRMKNAGVTRNDIQSWQRRYENMERVRQDKNNPTGTPAVRAELMKIILEKW